MGAFEVTNLVILMEFEFASEGHTLFPDIFQDIGIDGTLLMVYRMAFINQVREIVGGREGGESKRRICRRGRKLRSFGRIGKRRNIGIIVS